MKVKQFFKLKPKSISIKKIKHKKRLMVIVILVIIISLIGFSVSKPKVKVVTDYVELKKDTLIKNVNTTGEVESNYKVNVYSTLNNTIKEVKVDVGDKVNEGDILCVLDSTTIEREISETAKNVELDKAKAKVNLDDKKQAYDNASYILNNNINSSIKDCEEALNTAKIKLDDCNREYERKKALYDSGASPQSELDQAKSQLDTAQSDFDKSQVDLEHAKVKAKQEVETAKNEYEQAVIDYSSNKDEITLQGKKDDLGRCVIKAPCSGTITEANATVGNAAEGILFKIEDLDDPVIVIDIKEVDINKIMEGQEVEVSTDACDDDEFAIGKVTSISDAVKSPENMSSSKSNSSSNNSSTSSNSSVFEGKIKLDDPEGNSFIKVGMSAKANVILDKREDIFAVPFTSILEEDDGKYIKIAQKNDDGTYTVRSVPVTTGLETDISVEIESDDIKDGDKLIADPSSYKDGEIVNLVQSTEENGNE